MMAWSPSIWMTSPMRRSVPTRTMSYMAGLMPLAVTTGPDTRYTVPFCWVAMDGSLQDGGVATEGRYMNVQRKEEGRDGGKEEERRVAAFTAPLVPQPRVARPVQ